MQIRLFGKPGCHLCEEAEAQLRRLTRELQVVDISSDPRLVADYGLRIPVLQVDDREYDAPLDAETIRRALASH